MRRWSELAERVAATTRTSEKTALLAEYLADPDADELPIAAVFLTGRPFARPISGRPGSAGRRSRRRSPTSRASTAAALGEAYDRSSDLGAAVEDVLAAAGHAPDPASSPTLPEVAAAFAAIEAASGPAAQGGDPARRSWRGPIR